MKLTEQQKKNIQELVKTFNQKKHPDHRKQNVFGKAARFLRGKESDNDLDTKDIILRLSLCNIYEVNALCQWMETELRYPNTTQILPAVPVEEIQKKMSTSAEEIKKKLENATSMYEIKNAILPVEQRLAEIERKIKDNPSLACATVSGNNMLGIYIQRKIQPTPQVLQKAKEASLHEIDVLLEVWKGKAPSFEREQFSDDSLLIQQILEEMQDLPLDTKTETVSLPSSSSLPQEKSGIKLFGIDYDQTYHPLHIHHLLTAIIRGDFSEFKENSYRAILRQIAIKLEISNQGCTEEQAVSDLKKSQNKFSSGRKGEFLFDRKDRTKDVEGAIYDVIMQDPALQAEKEHLQNTEAQLCTLLSDPKNKVYILSHNCYSPFMKASIERFEEMKPEYKGRMILIGTYEVYFREHPLSWKKKADRHHKEQMHIPMMIEEEKRKSGSEPIAGCILVDDDTNPEKNKNLRRLNCYLQATNDKGVPSPFKAEEMIERMRQYGGEVIKAIGISPKSLLRLPLETIPEKLGDVTVEGFSNQQKCSSLC